ERARPLRNVGALSALRVPVEEIEGDMRYTALRHRLREIQAQGGSVRRLPLLPLARLKPLMVVRTPSEFHRQAIQWLALYFAGFYLVALVWGLAHFRGDRAFLPALHLLTGFGLALMLSMRDPLRDTLEFHKFAVGVLLGCVLLSLPALQLFD